PVERIVRSVESVTFDVAPADPALYPAFQGSLGHVVLGFASELAGHVDVYEGSFPGEVDANSREIPVLVYRDKAKELGLHAGERFVLSSGAEPADGRTNPVVIPVVVSGVWKANDDHDAYWFSGPSSLTNTLLVPEGTYNRRVASLFKNQFL